jgi:Co/Zn/Cd efflux system component
VETQKRGAFLLLHSVTMAGGSKMAWSKTTRIKVMIAIDTSFFLLELIAGFLSHSLALTADAFHMVRSDPLSPVSHRGR